MKKLIRSFFAITTIFLISSISVSAQLKYSFSAAPSAYTALSGASSFSWAVPSTDDGYSNPTNIGFTFNYAGTDYTQFQVSTNGFLRFGTDLISATPTDALNGVLRRLVAPFWDDLAVSSTATDVTYKLSGITGSRVLTVEWKNVKWPKTNATANVEFQVRLYEADGNIEFAYGTTVAPTTPGGASIGLADNSVITSAAIATGTFLSVNLGGTGSYHLSMGLPFNTISLVPPSNTVFTFSKVTLGPIPAGTYTVGGTSPTYATLSQAAMALNNRGISGAVTLNIRPGTYDDVFHLINVAGTSSSATITVKNESGTVTISPLNGSLVSTIGPTATTGDAIIRLDGTQYTTIKGLNLVDSDLNTTLARKFEIGVLLANSAVAGYSELLTNVSGARFNTLENLNIDMKSGSPAPLVENGGAVGIRLGTIGTTFDTSKANSYNTIKNCTIKNFHRSGIWMYGFYGTNPDRGNKITGCTIGPVAHNSSAADIRTIEMNCQFDFTIESSTIENIKFTGTAITQNIYGIWLNPANSSVDFNGGNMLISGVTVRDLEINAPTATTGLSVGISTNRFAEGSTLTIRNCRIYDIATVGGAAGSARAQGMLLVPGSNNGSTTLNVFNNYVYDVRAPNATTNPSVRGIEINPTTGVVNANVYYNTVYIDNSVAPTVASHFSAGIFWANFATSFLDLRNNSVVNLMSTGTAGTGRVVALFPTSNANFGRMLPISDNNLYFVGAGSNRGISFDGTTLNVSLASHQTAVATVGLGGPRDLNSVTELPPYTTAPTAINTGVATQIESGAKPITSPINITTDFYGNARNAVKPDIGAEEGNFTVADLLGPTITYDLFKNTTSTSNRSVSVNSITDPNGVDVTTNLPRLWYKRPWHANVFNDNTNTTDGWKYVSSTSTLSPFAFTIDYSKLYDGSRVIAAGDTIQYFVTAYDVPGNVNSNPRGFAGSYATPTVFPTPNLYYISNTFPSVVTVGTAGTYSSLTAAGGLFEALNKGVLTGNLTVNITSDLTSEDGSNFLNEISEEGIGNYTVTIQPGDASEKLISGNLPNGFVFNGADRVTVDGRFSGSGKYLRFRNTNTSWACVEFRNDAKNNTLKYCIFEASSGVDGVIDIASTFIGGTGNDFITIDNCDIRDRSDAAVTPAYGILAFGRAGSVASHNDNITISNNNIYNFFNPAASSIGIYLAEGNTNWTITGNSFYQTSARTFTAGVGYFAMLLAGSLNSGGFNITNNYIGGSAPLCAGSPTVITSSAGLANFAYLIRIINVGQEVVTNITGNTFSNIDFTNNTTSTGSTSVSAQVFSGILVNNGYVNINNNVFGGATGTSSLKFTLNGTNNSSTTFSQGYTLIDHRGSKCDSINSNVLGSIEVVLNLSGTGSAPTPSFYGINTSGNLITPSFKLNNNLIGSLTTANSWNVTGDLTDILTMIGIITSNIAPITINQNTVANLTNGSSNASSQLIGILQGGNGVGVVTNNKVYNLSAASASTSAFGALYGIGCTGAAHGDEVIANNEIYSLSLTNTGAFNNAVAGIVLTNPSYSVITKNKIYDLRNASTGSLPQAVGIRVRSTSIDCQISNNMVSLGHNESTNTQFIGIQNSFSNAIGALTMFYNTISIGGTVTSGSVPTFAVLRGDNTANNIATSFFYKNNIFQNTRTGGTGKHYAIGNQTTTPAPSVNWNIKSNFNNFYTANPATLGLWGTVDCNLATWQSNSGSSKTLKPGDDENSFADGYSSNVLVNFVDQTNGDLHLTGSSIGDGNLAAQAISQITVDYDNQARNAYWAYKGADEVTTSPLSLKLTLKALIEGFYGNGFNDPIDVRLAHATSFVKSPPVSGLTSATGTDFYLPKGTSSTQWIVINHLNTIETWSASAIAFPSGVASYDFTNAQTKAYGDNLKLVAGKWCMFSGDVPTPIQDGLIDLTDVIAIINDANAFASGTVIPSDLNGDDSADLSDIILAVNNANAFVTKITPEPKSNVTTEPVKEEVTNKISLE